MVEITKKIVKKIMTLFPSSYVLMFHHISLDSEIKRSGCMLSTELFQRQVDSIKRPDTLEVVVNHPFRRKTAITFDDGLADLYTIAYPYLKSKNIPFTAFIVTEFLDKPGYITTEQLKEMSEDSLVTIGAHGVTHEVLNNLSPDEKQNEIIKSKEKLEHILGKEVKCFAYSHGAFDKECRKFTKIYDFCVGVSGMPVNFITAKIRWNIPRFNIEEITFNTMQKILKNI